MTIVCYHNARFCTLQDEGYDLREDQVMHVANGVIDYLGDAGSAPNKPDQMIDLKGHLVTPGLIDCHTHLVYGGDRANEFEMRLNGASYEEIARAGGGIISTVKATRAASEMSLLETAQKRLRSWIEEGVTTIEIKSGYGLDLASEQKMLRVAAALERENAISVRKTFLGAHAVPPEFKERADDYIEFLCETILPQLHEEHLVDAVDAFCEGIGFSWAQTEKLFLKAKSLGLPLKIHAEQLSDLKGAKHAANLGALSADHLEYLQAEDVSALKQNDTVAVLLPGAYYFLRETKLPPLEALRAHQVPIAIASDSNPGSSPAHSLLLMLNMACTLFRMTPLEALQGVTKNAAQALGVHNDRGTLSKGKRADFAVFDVQHPAELSYRFGANPCVGRSIGGDFSWRVPSEINRLI